VLFSERAVIQEIDGSLYFMFQVCEMKHHDLLEAQIRLYCIRHDEDGAFATFPMRIQQPDDDLGASVLLILPTRVVHRIDNWSPLSPTSVVESRLGGGAAGRKVATALPHSLHAPAWSEVPQRQVDAEQGNKATCVCPVCGDSFQNLQLLRRHTSYNAVQDVHNDVPEVHRHGVWLEEELQSQGWQLVEQEEESDSDEKSGGWKRCITPAEGSGPIIAPVQPTRSNVEAFAGSRHIEVVVLLEGTEPTTSSTLQARHSFVLPDDIEWDRAFEDCVEMGSDARPCAVNLGRFHNLISVDPAAKRSGRNSHTDMSDVCLVALGSREEE